MFRVFVCSCAVCMGIKNGVALTRGLCRRGQGSIDVTHQSSTVATPGLPVRPHAE
jgi:hypothetical protein